MSIILLVVRFLLIAALYSFIGWVVYTLWIEFYRKPDDNDHQNIPPVTLKFADEAGEKAVMITRLLATIGRDVECDINIQDQAVSARQARLSFRQNQWWLEDSNSTNGTYLNRERLEQPAVIMNNDLITCGNTHLEVIIS
ncbi:MAG: hypothetical protein C0391_03455 [Anaerolinea sp.]|nr:hypothetical protein [Anaerolinea sp.]